jgi:hypothetical protein
LLFLIGLLELLNCSKILIVAHLKTLANRRICSSVRAVGPFRHAIHRIRHKNAQDYSDEYVAYVANGPPHRKSSNCLSLPHDFWSCCVRLHL